MEQATCNKLAKLKSPSVPPQVTFKPDLTTAEVHDENIKGPLKVRQEVTMCWSASAGGLDVTRSVVRPTGGRCGRGEEPGRSLPGGNHQ